MPKLSICCGKKDRVTMKVKAVGLSLSPAPNRRGLEIAELDRWHRVGVFTKGNGEQTFYELVPGSEDRVVEFGVFSIRGQFDIAKETRDGMSNYTFEAFEPE